MIPKLGLKLLRDFTAFIITINGPGWQSRSPYYFFIKVVGYPYKVRVLLVFFDANFVVISVSAGLFEKNMP
jgi:hypothetical protein